MAEAEDVRTLALALPDTEERVTWNQPTFRVSGKIFAWITEDELCAGVKVDGKAERDELVASAPETFFYTDHDSRYNVVQLRLNRIEVGELDELVRAAWRATAPKRLLKEFDRGGQ
ncbi:MmcQ/YjbR family DNA-binding protein [Streptomyces sp. NBC_00445]|uniref:MmcQ/YjbR family DNA-binding protein n=1 Tax=unclassified Streptomyces TaxID=2593676 RepID=UPI002E201AE2|nr:MULTISPECIES: MmcQ/YjbR family DNA-binding protein [unclassified Streptomyces]